MYHARYDMTKNAHARAISGIFLKVKVHAELHVRVIGLNRHPALAEGACLSVGLRLRTSTQFVVVVLLNGAVKGVAGSVIVATHGQH